MINCPNVWLQGIIQGSALTAGLAAGEHSVLHDSSLQVIDHELEAPWWVMAVFRPEKSIWT